MVFIFTLGKWFILLELHPCVDSVEHLNYLWVKPTNGYMANHLLVGSRTLSGLAVIIHLSATHSISLDLPDYVQSCIQRFLFVLVVDIFINFNPLIDFLLYISVAGGHTQELTSTIFFLLLVWAFSWVHFILLPEEPLKHEDGQSAIEWDGVWRAILALVGFSEVVIWQQRKLIDNHCWSTSDIFPATMTSTYIVLVFNFPPQSTSIIPHTVNVLIFSCIRWTGCRCTIPRGHVMSSLHPQRWSTTFSCWGRHLDI